MRLTAPGAIAITTGVALGLDVLLIRNGQESESSFVGRHLPLYVLANLALTAHFAWPQLVGLVDWIRSLSDD